MKIAETLRLSLMNNTSNIIRLLLTTVMLLSLMMIARKLISANGLLLLLLQYVKQKLLQLISAQPSQIPLLVQLIKHGDMMLAFAPDL